MPAMSIVRNVALFGRPSAGPVIASISSIVYCARFERAQHLRHAVEADVIGDEVRRVLRDDDTLAESMIGKPRHALDDRAIGLGSRNDLEQMQVARRVEEMRAEPVTPEVVAASLGEGADRDARRVRRDDRSRPPRRIDAFEERALHVDALDDGFDDPVGAGDPREVVVETADRDERRGVGGEERIRLQRAGALQPVARDVGREVEQQRRDAGVREMRGDLRPHRAGAQHRNRSNRRRGAHRARAPLMNRSTDRVGVRFERVAPPAQDPVGRHLVERAEEHLRGDGRFDVGAKQAARAGRRRSCRE